MRWIWILIILINLTDCFASVKAVLFDCDGTLVDSEHAHYLGWKKALNDLGSDLNLEDYYQYVGKPAETNATLLAEKVGMDCVDLILKTKNQYYKDLCKAGLPPIASTLDFLKELASKKEFLGIKIGVCSAAKKEQMLSHLKHLEINDLFDVVLSGQEDLHEYSDPEGVNKPKPYIYLHAMKLLKVSPHETVVIEDSAPGALAGVSAGCFTIAVPNDYTKHHDFSHVNWKLSSFLGMNVHDFLNKVEGAQSLEKRMGNFNKQIQFDCYHTRLTLVKSTFGKENWLFLAGGPGADSEYFTELIELLNLPGNVWLVDLPENGGNKLGNHYNEYYDFGLWEKALKHVLKSFDNVILVGHSFSGIYPLLFPEIENDLIGLVILNSASRPWIENALRMAEEKNLPSFKKEMEEFLSNKTAETFSKARKVFVHYYFTPDTLKKGTEILFRGAFNFHAMNWWLSKAPGIDFDNILIPHIPTLIIGGAEDCAVPFKGYLTDTRFLKLNITLKEIEGGSHFPWLEKPEEIKRLFEQFAEKFK